MKFGGITSSGKGKAVIKSLKEQFLFDNEDNVRPCSGEVVVSFGTTRQVGGLSILDSYVHAIAKEKPVSSWKMLLGQYEYRYQIIPEKLQELTKESIDYTGSIDTHQRLRWHDLAVLVLLLKVTDDQSEIASFARSRLSYMAQINNAGIREAITYLQSADGYRQFV